MVKKIVVAIWVFSSFLYSSDVVTFYKSGGKKLLDQESLRSTYWSGSMLNKDLRFGYFESAISLLTCIKQKGLLELYTTDAQKRFLLKKRYPALTGKNPGDKMSEGDLKTPIGIYTLTEKKKTVDPFYGPMAYVTSYPNLYDKIRGKNGDGIWIHGVPLNGTRDEFTKGCIAINNKDLLQLDQTINPSKTLLLIDANSKKSIDPSVYSTILAAIYQWKYAWTYNDLERYLSFYHSSFKRFDGMNFDRFKEYKQRIFNKNEQKNITFSNVNIIPYPGEKPNLFLVTLDQTYTSDNHQYKGEKSILLTLNSDKSISILTEE